MAESIGQKNPLGYRGYYYDSETGLYYLQSRYYDPEIGRFINADGYVSTGQGLLGYNMFAYYGNNPVNHIDSTGYFIERTAGGGGGVAANPYALLEGLSNSFGGSGGKQVSELVGAAVVITSYLTMVIARQEQFALLEYNRQAEKAKEKAEEIATTAQLEYGNTYYHVTSFENAIAIGVSGIMVGNTWEGGYIYAWETFLSQYAIRNSGATRSGVIISFKTNTIFARDNGIDNPKVTMYNPVVSTRPGPIVVWDVNIVGVTR